MTIGGVSDRTAAIASNLINLKNQLDNLTTQLSTGMKGSTYQAFGTDTAVATGLRAQLSAYAGFSSRCSTVAEFLLESNSTHIV